MQQRPAGMVPCHPVFCLFNAACLALSNKCKFYYLWINRVGFESMFYRTGGEHVDHVTTDTVVTALMNPWNCYDGLKFFLFLFNSLEIRKHLD